jgi:hypothetical protein
MQTTRNVIALLVELATCIEARQSYLDTRYAQDGVHVGRYAAAVVVHVDGFVVYAEPNVNLGAKASHGFIDGIIHNFLHEMMQTP